MELNLIYVRFKLKLHLILLSHTVALNSANSLTRGYFSTVNASVMTQSKVGWNYRVGTIDTEEPKEHGNTRWMVQ